MNEEEKNEMPEGGTIDQSIRLEIINGLLNGHEFKTTEAMIEFAKKLEAYVLNG